jgi:hypothetical protein
MRRPTFHAGVRQIREWFTSLSPYHGQPPIFEDEDVNRWQGRPEPLYFLGVSAKRYALYNRLAGGTYRIRKFSSHGVGTWKSREGYVSPTHLPAPCDRVHKLGGERWHYDLWYDAIRAIDGGTLPNGQPVARDERGVPQYAVPDSPWLDAPAFHQATISTWKLYETYQQVPGIRPFSFITVLPPLTQRDIFWRLRRLEQAAAEGQVPWDEVDAAKTWYEGLAGVSFYAPYASSAAELRDIRRGDTHEVVDGITHRTLAEALRDYFRHPEWKSSDPRGVGLLPRRHVSAWCHQAIGKESNAISLMAAEETDGVVEGAEAGMDGAQVFDVGNLQETLQRFSMAELVRATGLPRRTIYDLRSGKVQEPQPETVAAIRRGLQALACCISSVRIRGYGSIRGS